MTQGLLAGVRVVEFGNLIAAPYAGMLLADLGAEVTKVEPPTGDLGRRFGPYIEGESVFFLAVNRGKRSLAVDPKRPEIRLWLDRLVARADVIINNLRAGAMQRMGYDEETVRRANPGAIYAVVSAFGTEGPHAERAGIDVVFQAESGMISLTGHPNDPPQKTATTIGDYVAATNAALTVCAALVARSRTGNGSRVDISLRDGLLAVQSGWMALYLAADAQPPRTGTASPFLAPNQVFEVADGHIALAVVSDRHFRSLADAIDRPDLADRFPTNQIRMDQLEPLLSELSEVLSHNTVDEWIQRLTEAGLPVGRVLDFDGVVGDPQIGHNEMVVAVEHPTAGEIRMVGSPLRVEGSSARASAPPPTLGQHTRKVLEELGADQAIVERLIEDGAAFAS